MTTPGLPPDSELAAGQTVRSAHLRALRDYIRDTAAQALAPSNDVADAAIDRAETEGRLITGATASATYLPARVVIGLANGTDQKAAIDTALAEADPAIGGPGVVLLLGIFATSGGHVSPEGVTVCGLGRQTTLINHTGNNACFTALGNTDFWKSHHFRGFTIIGNAGAAAKGIHAGNNYGQSFTDLRIQDYKGTDGIGLHLENTVLYSEGVQFQNVYIGNNKTGLRMSRSGTGTESFSECRLYGVNISSDVPNSVGLDLGAGCWLYGATIDMKIATASTATGFVGLRLTADSKIFGGRALIHFEGTTGTGIVSPPGAQLEFFGNFYAEGVNHLINGVSVTGRLGQREYVADGRMVGAVTTGNETWRLGRTPQDSRVVMDVDQINPALRWYRWTGSTDVHFPFGVVLEEGVLKFSGAPGAVPGAEILSPHSLGLGDQTVGFFGTAPINKPTVGGSRGGNAALDSLLIHLANLGLINNATTA